MVEEVLVSSPVGALDAEREIARQEVARRIREATALAIAALLGVAGGLALSIIFLPSSVLVAALAVPVGLMGLVAHFVLPPFLAHRRTKAQ